MIPQLTDIGVTREKFRRELDQWNNADPVSKGWILLRADEVALVVEIAFLAKLASTHQSGFVIAPCAIRLDYQNYDLWPPSLVFIDPITRAPTLPPVSAYLQTPEGPRNVLIVAHPQTGAPFLCLPGIREYHAHPQHTGDSWLLHRPTRAGSIATICDRVWRLMVRNVVGINVSVQSLPLVPLQAQVEIHVVQGDVDNISDRKTVT